MRPTRLHATVAVLPAFLLFGCRAAPDASVAIDYGPGVSRSLAGHRARTISNLAYDVTLAVPAERERPITGTVTAGFDLVETGEPLALDFTAPADSVHAVAANGAPADWEVRDEHLLVPAAALRSGANEVAIEFTAGDGSLNRILDVDWLARSSVALREVVR